MSSPSRITCDLLAPFESAGASDKAAEKKTLKMKHRYDHHKPMSEEHWLNRMIFLETVCGVFIILRAGVCSFACLHLFLLDAGTVLEKRRY